MTVLPTGEVLPEYDDDRKPSPVDLANWLDEHRPLPDGRPWAPARVSDVIDAVQSAGNATLVKNATYRAMRRDGRDIERLAAALDRVGANARVVEHDGNVVDAAIEGLQLLKETTEAAMALLDEMEASA